MGSFLAKGGRVLGKTVDQICPGFQIFGPFPFARCFSFLVSEKLMVFVLVLLAQFFVLCLLLFWSGLRLADAGNLDYENLVFDGTG